MATREAARADGIDVVAIVTPNHVHHPAAKAFLEAGIHVICDKPMTTNLEDALDLVRTVKRTGLVFCLTHNYTGFPMVREARERVQAGELGTIRVIQAEYPQDWLTTPLETTGQKQAAWRTDPAQSGGGAIGDIGSHAFNLAAFITGLEAEALLADLSTFVAGRRVDDNCNTCSATRAARAACSGPRRWRPATTTRSGSGSMATRAASPGTRNPRIFSTSCRSASRRNGSSAPIQARAKAPAA